MRDIFFFSHSSIGLADVREVVSEDCKCDLLLNANQDALQIRLEDQIIQMVQVDISKELGDPEDLEIINSTNVAACICVSHHIRSIDHIKEWMKKLLEIYGGWVGNDSESFEPRFSLDNIDSFKYSD